MKKPFNLTTSASGMPAIEIANATPEIHALLKSIITCNHIDDQRYVVRQAAGAFFQSGSRETCGEVLIEFWNGTGAQAFVDFANELFKKQNSGHHQKIEYDLTYTGGNYSSVGQFAYIPHALIDSLGSVEAAFEIKTGHDRQHIICTYDEEVYDSKGRQIK